MKSSRFVPWFNVVYYSHISLRVCILFHCRGYVTVFRFVFVNLYVLDARKISWEGYWLTKWVTITMCTSLVQMMMVFTRSHQVELYMMHYTLS